MATGTFSPGIGATFPVDGRVARETARDEAFSTIRTSAGDAASVGDIAQACQVWCSTTSNQFQAIERSIFCFDTTLIPAGNVISAGTLQFYVVGTASTIAGSASIVVAAPANTNNLVNSDYNIANWTMTKQATDISLGTIGIGAYLPFALNATGLSNVKVAGTTIFGMVTNFDADNTAPTWSSNAQSRLDINFADGVNKPQLIVTYQPSSSGLQSKYW